MDLRLKNELIRNSEKDYFKNEKEGRMLLRILNLVCVKIKNFNQGPLDRVYLDFGFIHKFRKLRKVFK